MTVKAREHGNGSEVLGNDIIWTGETLHDNENQARREANIHLTKKLSKLLAT